MRRILKLVILSFDLQSLRQPKLWVCVRGLLLNCISNVMSLKFPECFFVVNNSWCVVQDRVPAFSAEKAMAFIEKELGAPVDELFADFERQPIAAASLGQVASFFKALESHGFCQFKSTPHIVETPESLLEIIIVTFN